MGALLFAIIISIIFLISLFLIFIGICEKLRKSKSTNTGASSRRKSNSLNVGLIMLIIPSLYVMFLRMNNMSTRKFIETDINIIGYQTESFIINQKQYHIFSVGEPGFFRVGEAIATWHGTQSILETILGYYNVGNYFTVPNEMNFDLLSDGQNRIFCSEDDFENASLWYNNPLNYNFYFSDNNGDGINQELFQVPNIKGDEVDELKRLNDSYNTTSEDIIKLEISIYETPTRYTFYWMSKDLVIEQYYFNYIYYQNTLVSDNSILNSGKDKNLLSTAITGGY